MRVREPGGGRLVRFALGVTTFVTLIARCRAGRDLCEQQPGSCASLPCRRTMMWGPDLGHPDVGPILYLSFGINRHMSDWCRRIRLHSGRSEALHLAPLVEVVTTVTGTPLLPGNQIEPLLNAEQAFPSWWL